MLRNIIDQYFYPWRSFFTDHFEPLRDVGGYPTRSHKDSSKSYGANLINFFGSTTLIIVVAFIASSQAVPLEQGFRLWTLRVFLLLLVAAWISVAVVLKQWSPTRLGTIFLLICILSSPTAMIALEMAAGIQPHASFWSALVLWSGLAILGVRKVGDGWTSVLFMLGAAWSVSMFICWLGLLPGLPYSRAALASISEVHTLLDIRVTITAVFGAGLGITAFINTWRDGIPEVPTLPVPTIPVPNEAGSFWSFHFIRPFLVVANILVELLHALGNVLWQALAIIIVFFIRVGVKFAQAIRDMGTNRRATSWILTCLASFIVMLLLYYVAAEAAVPALSYLAGGEGFREVFKPLALLVSSTLVGVVLVAIAVWLIESDRDDLAGLSPQSLMFILNAFFLSGIMMYGLSRIETLELHTFRNLGPFTILFLALVVIGTIFYIYQRFSTGHGTASNDL